ncbi:MAG: DUF4012 domain-containing protein [Candidatus Magasanikbacteria bacterium]
MKLLKILLLISATLAVLGAIGVYFFQNGVLQETVINEARKQIPAIATAPDDLIQNILGLKATRHYLLLFLNNTEMRPGGGFIGSYGVVKMEGGRPEILKVEGTEILDYSQDDFDLPPPPQPISEYLKVKKWYFRDSNWSPDFASSSERALDFYRREKGLAADSIDGVIGLTPTVIAEILKVTGPIKMGGLEFNSDNFVEKLEYQVEYGYKEDDIAHSDRKLILGDLARALMQKIKYDAFLNWKKYFALVERLIAEKQIIFYSTDAGEQKSLINSGWAGEMKKFAGDYLLWADANLGALKTDLAVEKSLSYSLTTTSIGYESEISMTYQHSGNIDWRTSRYRTYARAYVPAGSKLVAGQANTIGLKTVEKLAVDQGVENGRQWFGAFVTVAPGQSLRLSFKYVPAPAIVKMIEMNDYGLLVQKQLGSENVKLTLGMDFGKKVVSATPPEAKEKFGDNRYDLPTDLTTDRKFEIKW